MARAGRRPNRGGRRAAAAPIAACAAPSPLLPLLLRCCCCAAAALLLRCCCAAAAAALLRTDGSDVEGADLGEAGEDVVTEGRLRQELVDEGLDELGLKDVPERDPVEELEQRLEGAHQQGLLDAVGHDVLAELEDQREVGVERLLELFGLG